MGSSFLLHDLAENEFLTPQQTCRRLSFPLEKYGYSIENVLNNENRHHLKLVCAIRRYKDRGRFVSTTYANHEDYLRLVETTTCLKCNHKLSPEITELYSRENTVVCKHIGEFLSDYLAAHPDCIEPCLRALFEFIQEINSINRRIDRFTIPSIVRISLSLSENSRPHFNFLPRSRPHLLKLEKKNSGFLYGCGVEDPHIWNYRIVKQHRHLHTLTTDFDYFSDNINPFWALGYFYATLRWLKRDNLSIRYKAKEILLSLVRNNADLKSEFMFWLGVLSSYCGYRDSICGILTHGQEFTEELAKQFQTIDRLDKKIALLASQF